MPKEPGTMRAVSFIDGQNLYRHAKDAFGHHHPNYDPGKLTAAVCKANGWQVEQIRFYTGIPATERSEIWHGYWTRRLNVMQRAGIVVTKRQLHYRREQIQLQDGLKHDVLVAREKGIDLRLGLDVVRMARNGEFDVAVIFSQDQDLSEVAREVRDISRTYGRQFTVVSAFPVGPRATSKRGIDQTKWFRMNRAFYDACLDPRDYRSHR